MKPLLSYKGPRPRFARSINVERDSGSNAVDGYLPVGRAIDAISRFASALDRPDVEVAISITGPYGSGKSSLAIILDALVGPAGDPTRTSAEELLEHTAGDALRKLRSARRRLKADRRGFIRATVTAQREPITATVVRALLHGAERYKPTRAAAPKLAAVVEALQAMESTSSGENWSRVDTREIRQVVTDLGAIAPVFLLIDEFGKNLEAFADSQSDADLFLLQELAEWTQGGDGIPLALITLQHMAFDEYADTASAGQRREWAKIQGRFEDIPFVDSASQTRSLIAAAFERPSRELAEAQSSWAVSQADHLRGLGLNDLAANPTQLEDCWPLHPLALAALPELCERYGQNERTLFSFLAGHEPLSVASFLAETTWTPGHELPVVRLDRLYDYFLESAANLVTISANASRWLEIDTRVRDAVGLDEASRRVLKTVGLLNLVSAGGTLRASRPIICRAAADSLDGTATGEQVEARLDDLENAGLITYREFADEYRVWQGSDFDLRSAISLARRRLRDDPSSATLNRVLPLSALVAARHSHQSGTLRAFQRVWARGDAKAIEPLGTGDRHDGLVLYVLGNEPPKAALTKRHDAKPVVFVTTEDPSQIIDAARELAAIDEVLGTTSEVVGDWVARRELLERRVEAIAALEREFNAAYGDAAATWYVCKPRGKWRQQKARGSSSVVSLACDEWYESAPTLRNDLINRHDLSSQAAKARRMLVEAMISQASEAHLGVQGSGPDKTMYLSVLEAHGLHRQNDSGEWNFSPPNPESSFAPAWDRLYEVVRSAVSERVRLSDLYDSLAAPPYGVRPGVVPILFLVAAIVGKDEIALYEHGTLRPVLADDVVERLLKNPVNFEVKYYASRTGSRADYLQTLSEALEVRRSWRSNSGGTASVMAVVSYLVALTNGLPEHIKKTRHLSAQALGVRRLLVFATEPDVLLFNDIPAVFDEPPVRATSPYDPAAAKRIASGLARVCAELLQAYPEVLREVHVALRDHVGPSCDPLREGLAARANELEGKIIDPRVRKLTVALTADIPDTDSWLSYIAMNVSGVPPEGWSDEDRKRFFVTIAEIGATFRRIHALNADLEARGDGFDAYRHVITRTDGTEIVQLVSIDAPMRKSGQPIVERAIAEISTELSVSSTEARRILFGLLGEADFFAEATAAPSTNPGSKYGSMNEPSAEGSG